jgi:putative DNA primase/helicase
VRDALRQDERAANDARNDPPPHEQSGEDRRPAAGSDLWPDPLPIPNDLPPVPPFNLALLPEAFVTFVTDVSERMQCPPDFTAVAIMVALAGVVGKKVGIRPKRFDDWLVIANLWAQVIGRPGIMKTPAIRQAIKFLQRLEIAARKRHAEALREYQDRLLVVEAQKKVKSETVREAVKKASKSRDSSAAADAALNAARNFVVDDPKEPTLRRYEVNDSTVEKLGMLLNENPNGLTVFRDELIGFLRQLDKEGQESARAFYLEAWDGQGSFTYDRVGRGTLPIDTVTLSILGGGDPRGNAGLPRGGPQGRGGR